jgi:hypothetical protein
MWLAPIERVGHRINDDPTMSTSRGAVCEKVNCGVHDSTGLPCMEVYADQKRPAMLGP